MSYQPGAETAWGIFAVLRPRALSAGRGGDMGNAGAPRQARPPDASQFPRWARPRLVAFALSNPITRTPTYASLPHRTRPAMHKCQVPGFCKAAQRTAGGSYPVAQVSR